MENTQSNQPPAGDVNQIQSPQPPAKKDVMNELGAPSEQYVREAESKALDWMNPKRWNMMKIISDTWINCGALPSTIKNAPQMMMVLQAGYESGLQPLESLGAYYFVNGRLTMYGEAVISQVVRAGHTVQWGECNEKTATVKITRKDNGANFEQTFTIEQAKSRGLAGKDVWIKFPESMLRYRVFGMVARFIVPDALHGIQIKEEIEAVGVEQDVKDEPASVDIKPVDVKPAAQAAKVSAKKDALAAALGLKETPPASDDDFIPDEAEIVEGEKVETPKRMPRKWGK